MTVTHRIGAVPCLSTRLSALDKQMHARAVLIRDTITMWQMLEALNTGGIWLCYLLLFNAAVMEVEPGWTDKQFSPFLKADEMGCCHINNNSILNIDT